MSSVDDLERHRAWMTRIVAIVCVAVITGYAMFLQLDGIFVPLVGASIVSGLAGYEVGATDLLERITDGGETEPSDGRGEK